MKEYFVAYEIIDKETNEVVIYGDVTTDCKDGVTGDTVFRETKKTLREHHSAFADNYYVRFVQFNRI